MKKILRFFILFLLWPFCVYAGKVYSWKNLNNEFIFIMSDGNLHIKALNKNSVRIQFCRGEMPKLEEYIYCVEKGNLSFNYIEKIGEMKLMLPEISTIVNLANGSLSFMNNEGDIILSEKENGRLLKASKTQGDKGHTYISEQTFVSPEDEYLFGTGQFQDGYLNIKGLTRHMEQFNTQISVPFIYSNKGYGLLWNNFGLTEYNPIDNFTQMDLVAKGVSLFDGKGLKFSKEIEVFQDGKYSFLFDLRKDGDKHIILIDGKVYDQIPQYLPPIRSMLADLKRGKHIIEIITGRGTKPLLSYKKVENITTFRSPVSSCLDYTVFAGHGDEIISSYRAVTGGAPLMPKWVLGYIHCRERYHSQKELLENAHEFRSRRIPIDLIVQDWQYWGKYGWNAMKFDEKDYPDPASMVNDLHQNNIKLMLSVWPNVDKGSELGKQLLAKDYYIGKTEIGDNNYVDFFNKDAADFYWNNSYNRLAKPYKIDAWWQDATEPESQQTRLLNNKVNNGKIMAEEVRNIYSMMVSKAVYLGVRKDIPNQRTFILTRNSCPGQQRYSAAVWSGDVGSDWETYRRQICAGLNYVVTGLPWWTYDAGGFWGRPEDQYTNDAYRECLTRWIQTATFLPLMRIHGIGSNTEPWRYGGKFLGTATKYIKFRYRMLPYIYSQNAEISFNGSSIMRPFVMDFPADTKALDCKYSYMFGPSILVAPVVERNVKSMDVYLPNSETWYNFWSGKKYNGNQIVHVNVDNDEIPLFVKAGSILPLYEEQQYTSEKNSPVTELRIYEGKDAEFTLYEDDGVTYDYENGKFSKIRLVWNDSKKMLTISAPEGKYESMPSRRVFKVVRVKSNKGVGFRFGKTTKTIVYTNEEISAKI